MQGCRGGASTLVPHPQTGPLVRFWGAPRGALPLPHLEPQAPPHLPRASLHGAGSLSTSPPPHPHVALSPSEAQCTKGAAPVGGDPPTWSVLLRSAGWGASAEKGQLGVEIPLVFSHGQQGLFKEYIQLKIDFSV